jgi:hypothetical protein
MVLRVSLLPALRHAFRSSLIHGVIVEDVIKPEICALLRDRVREGLVSYGLADRGRYQVNETHEEPEIAGVLADLCGSILDEKVIPGRARWTRFVHGDYALYKDHAYRRRGRTEPYELVLDFSAQASADGQVVYVNRESGFAVPQQPGLLGLVDLRGGVQRYDRYLTARVRGDEVFRLSLPLSNR